MQPDEPPPKIHPPITPPQRNLPALLDIQIVRLLLIHQKGRLQTPEIAHHGLDGIVQYRQGRDLERFPRGRLFGFGLLDCVFEVGAFAVELGAEVVEHLLDFFGSAVHGLKGIPEDAEEGEESDDEGDEAYDYAGVGDGRETGGHSFYRVFFLWVLLVHNARGTLAEKY